jgi:hypothetical protein
VHVFIFSCTTTFLIQTLFNTVSRKVALDIEKRVEVHVEKLRDTQFGMHLLTVLQKRIYPM